MSRRCKSYLLAIGIVGLLGVYWGTSQWWATHAPRTPGSPVDQQADEQELRSVLQEILLSEDTQLLLASLLPPPQEEQLASEVADYLLQSGTLHQLVHQVMGDPQFKSTIVALVKEPEVQAVIKASIDLDDIQFLMEELLSTAEGQAFIMDLLTGLISGTGAS